MFNKAIAAVFGTSNERELKRIQPLVEQINSLEPAMKQLTDEQLRAKTEEFRQRIRERVDAVEDPEEKDRELKAVLDEILPEAFAVVREGGWRVLHRESARRLGFDEALWIVDRRDARSDLRPRAPLPRGRGAGAEKHDGSIS